MRRITVAAELADHYDIAIIGAGPAGMSAAVEASLAGATVLVVDENTAPGGQIYRAVTRHSRGHDDVLGADYWKGASIADPFMAATIDFASSTTVWSLDPAEEPSAHATIGLTLAGSARRVEARAVILATGAMERPMPVPGWTLPGVMTAGAAQIALKSIAAIPEGPTVLAGCGPLLYLLASQLLKAGADITAVLDTADAGQRLRALPHLPAFLGSPYFAKGLRLLVDVRRQTRVISGITDLAIDGDAHAQSVTFRRGRRSETLPVRTVLLHQGVIPSINLASSADCAIRWNEHQRAFQPEIDHLGRLSVPGLFAAGDGAGIGGADHAAVEGRIAALGALSDLGLITQGEAETRLAPLKQERRRYRRGRAFLDILYRPAQQFLSPPDDATIICRCEEVRAGQLRQVIELGVPGPNQLKTFIRCGMGPCQGRLCASTVTEMMAEQRGVSPAEIGTYRLRAPIKPVRLSELAALPQTEDAVFAVTGRRPEPSTNPKGPNL
ncbi:FAD-dependent oxidoreductase [Tianweitania aestuarii]|nr:FAD-dependent oxidoreductase [Tianweitania aestuarii]